MYPIKLLLIVAFVCPTLTNNNTASELTFDAPRFSIVFKNKYAAYFDSNCYDVFTKIKTTLPIIINEAERNQVDPKLALAVAAPEMFRYSAFKDFFETSALETLYVNYGSTAADFSIGHFQMKPSFVEKLEESYEELVQYKSTLPINIRRERIQRLSSKKWQAKYVVYFCKWMEEKYTTESFSSIEEKVTFYATAYNLGLNTSKTTIYKWQNKKVFPYGKDYGNKQCVYSNIAKDIYQHLIYI